MLHQPRSLINDVKPFVKAVTKAVTKAIFPSVGEKFVLSPTGQNLPAVWTFSNPTMSAERIEARAKEAELRQTRRKRVRNSEACEKEKLLKDEQQQKAEAEGRAKEKQLRDEKRKGKKAESMQRLRLQQKSEVRFANTLNTWCK